MEDLKLKKILDCLEKLRPYVSRADARGGKDSVRFSVIAEQLSEIDDLCDMLRDELMP